MLKIRCNARPLAVENLAIWLRYCAWSAEFLFPKRNIFWLVVSTHLKIGVSMYESVDSYKSLKLHPSLWEIARMVILLSVHSFAFACGQKMPEACF